MKLFHRDLSPQSAQVRAQIYAKQLSLPMTVVTENESLNGLGPNALPRLVLGDGSSLTESWAIMEFLETLYPLPRLMPESALGQAQLRVKASIANRHLMPLLLPLFLKIKHSQYADVDIEQSCQQLAAVYGHFEQLLAEHERSCDFRLGTDAVQPLPLDLADCALAPAFYFAQSLPQLYGQRNVLPDFPRVKSWWTEVQAHAAIVRVNYELQRGFQTYLST